MNKFIYIILGGLCISVTVLRVSLFVLPLYLSGVAGGGARPFSPVTSQL